MMLCAATMAFAQSHVTMTTSREVGSELKMTIGMAEGEVVLDGLEGEVEDYGVSVLKVTKPTFTITGKVELVIANDCGITSADLTNAPELLTFKAEQNKLTRLDLRGNKELTTLFCSLNALDEIDVTGLPKLKMFSCHSNNLTRLDVTKNENLKELFCYNNQLTELDVTKCAKLSKLSCGNNQLSALNLSGNKMLGALFCQQNKLETLDVTGIMFLTQLAFGENNIKSIDLSKSSDLMVLYANDNPLTGTISVKHMKNLMQLYVYNTNLTSIDLSGNPALDEFSCSHNQISELDFSNNPGVRYMWVQDNKIGTEAMKKLVGSLPARSEASMGTLIMKDVKVEDMNECLKEDVQKAREKSWTLYAINDEKIDPYEGVATGMDMTYAQQMNCRFEQGIVSIEHAKPNVAFEVYSLGGEVAGKGTTDAQGTAQMSLPALEGRRIIVKVAQCGIAKL